MKLRPKIGITMRLELPTRRFYLGRDYSEALVAAGALPVHIPLIPDVDYISDVVEGLDGILLPGADCDPDPGYYSEDPHPKLGKVVPEKDETDILVLAEADSRGLPVLGICFGMQILNVSRGGNLIQDIGSQVESPIKHDQGIPLERTSHRIRIDKESRLARIAGDGVAEIKVNSHHHQAVRTPGRDLKITAWATDGVVECIEETGSRFVMGVQWHPEMAWASDDVSKRIFAEFVVESQKFAAAKRKVKH